MKKDAAAAAAYLIGMQVRYLLSIISMCLPHDVVQYISGSALFRLAGYSSLLSQCLSPEGPRFYFYFVVLPKDLA